MSRLFWLCIMFFAGGAHAADWQVVSVDPALYPNEIVVDERAEVPQNGDAAGLPDGRVATYSGGDISSAHYIIPTKRYRHAILGDAIEAGGLSVTTNTGAVETFILPDREVFEDRTPYLVDLDGDGVVEVVTIRSSLSQGAAVTIYGLENGALVEKATTDFHGRVNRWLNIAGLDDFNGDGIQEVAFVRTPHIGGTLYFYRYENGAFENIAQISGFSNHEIGSREQRLSAVMDVNQDGLLDLALPSNDRRSLRMVGFVDGKLRDIDKVKFPSAIDKAITTKSQGGFVIGTRDGKVYEISR